MANKGYLEAVTWSFTDSLIDKQFSKGKKELEKNVFLAGPYGDKLRCYCLKTENDFKNLIEIFFVIKDSGYSCHKLFGRRINEWIICAEKA